MGRTSLAVIALLLQGCVYVPLFNVKAPGSCDPRGRIGPADSDKRLKLTVTDRQYVIKTLGNPEAESLDGRQIVYIDDRLQGIYWFPFHFHCLCVGTRTWTELTFDCNNVLTGIDSTYYATGSPAAAWFVGGDPTEVDLPAKWSDRYP